MNNIDKGLIMLFYVILISSACRKPQARLTPPIAESAHEKFKPDKTTFILQNIDLGLYDADTIQKIILYVKESDRGMPLS